MFDRQTDRRTDSPKSKRRPQSLEPSPEKSDYSWLTTPSPVYHDTHKRRNIVPNTMFYGQSSDDSSSVTSKSDSIKSRSSHSDRHSVEKYEKDRETKAFAYNQDHSKSNGHLPNGNAEANDPSDKDNSRSSPPRGPESRKSPPKSSDSRESPQSGNQRKKISPVSVQKKPVLMKTISVSDIGSIRVKKKNGDLRNGHEAAQNFLSRKQEETPRRKSLFGRGGSLFDLFGLSQNNQDTDSSSSSSSADTVIESPSPQVQRKALYKSKSSAHIDSGRISPLTVAPGRTLAEQIRIDKEREDEERRKVEMERRTKEELEQKRRDEELLARQKYEQEVEAARTKARERQDREDRARGIKPAPVVSQRSLLIASKHLEDERRKSRRFSQAEMATARSLLDKLNITKKTNMTETDTVKLKKQKSRAKVK